MRIRAAVAIAGTLVGACGPSWPGRATTVSDPRLVRGAVRSVDVLPVDLQLWSDGGAADPDALRGFAEGKLLDETLRVLATTEHAGNALSWEGNVDGVPAMDAKMVDATVGLLSGYGSLAGDAPHGLPVPFLPARLGEQTHADATLYLGGWAYVSKPSDSNTGEKIAEGVLIVVAIVAVVGLIAVLTKGKGGDGMGRAAGHVAGQVARASLRAGTALIDIGRVTTRVGEEVVEPVLDAWGRSIDVPSRPDWSIVAPHDGDSAMYLEATLVDNRTGLAVWHAHQTFPARADWPDEVARAARVVLASLPR